MNAGRTLAHALGRDWNKLDSYEQSDLHDCAWESFRIVITWLCAPNEDGSPCSVEREMLAQRLERGEHLK